MITSDLLFQFAGGFVLLILGAEALVRGASRLAVSFGISPLVVGLTVVAYGTSAPEVAVTIQATYADPPRPDLAIGNVVGSNISNILLVLGISSLCSPLLVSRTLVRSTVPFMVLVTGLVWAMSLDGQIDRHEGVALLVGAALFSIFSVARSRRATAAALAASGKDDGTSKTSKSTPSVIINIVSIAIGLGLLIFGARWLVDGASEVAKILHVSELIVGLTVVAVGTSLPEIATTLIATLRGHRDMAVGNVVGSNIFNLLLVLGLCASVAPQPIMIPSAAQRFDIPIMFAVTAACWPIFFTEWTISRWEGVTFLAFYAAYTLFLYLQATQHSGLDQYTTVMLYFVLPLTILVLVICSTRHWRNGYHDPLHTK